MKLAFIIIAAFLVYCLVIFLLDHFFEWLYFKDHKMDDGKWHPQHKLEHAGVELFHLPFTPNSKEVIYIENAYDEKANEFIKKNFALINEKFASKGFCFRYLPALNLSAESLIRTAEYYMPEGLTDDMCESIRKLSSQSLKSSFLIDHMFNTKNRGNIKPGFAWYNYTKRPFNVDITIYDYITFDAEEALDDPSGVLDEICDELGHGYSWAEGLYCTLDDDLLDVDDKFDAETRKILDEIRIKLDEIRLRGVSEAVIAQYLKSNPKLSHLLITYDFRIYLTDFKNREVKMEPLNKAVFLLFLRHPEGIYLKELSDYRQELAYIYQAIKDKKNNVDERLKSGIELQISSSIESLTDPLDNSVNEKCARVKETFLLIMHESVAEHYFITGERGEAKSIKLPKELVVWEHDRKEGKNEK